jgi:hypothetical protein
MTEYIGRRITAGICKEATRGTTPGDPTIYWLRLLAQNHKDQAEYVDSQASLGTVVEFSDSEVNSEWAEGGAEIEIDSQSLPLLLYSLLGNLDSAQVGSTDAYNHTVTLNDEAQRQSLSYFVDEPVSDKVFPLFCVGSLEFDFNLTDRPSLTVNAMSRKSGAGDSTPVFAEPNLFRPKDVKFYYADTVAGLGAGTEVKLKSLSLNFDGNQEKDDVLGEGRPEDFLAKQLSTSASIEFLHRDETLKGLFQAGTPKAIRIEVKNEANPADAGASATGTITIVDYTGLTGDTFTVGAVTLTEGVDFDAETSNDVTATNLANAIDALAGVGATASTNEVTITATEAGTAGNSIALATNAGADATVSGANLAGGVNPIASSFRFDFAKCYFKEWDEDNSRDDLKSQSFELSFAVDTQNASLPFGEVVVTNDITSY